MESHDELTPEQARTALAEVVTGRSAAGRRIATPWWFHPLLGLALAATLSALSLRGPAQAVVLVLSLVAQAALYALYRRLTGLWVNTWNVPELKRATAVATAVYLTTAVAAMLLESAGVRGAGFAAGIVLGIGYVVHWRWIERRLTRLWSG